MSDQAAANAATILKNLTEDPVPEQPASMASRVVRLSAVRRRPITWLCQRYMPGG
ncbi:hypothetical protein [Streptomyces cacaoi]|uniref:hypothetical protein n=1 Tax=Streptomyces cacaoi TaxID=1898 RepID=UPI00260D568B|nr:hypothetical protein [Streptomyces cacaoi]